MSRATQTGWGLMEAADGHRCRTWKGPSAPSTQDSHLHTLRRETHFLTRQTTAGWNKPLGKNDLETTQNVPTILFTQRLNFCPQTPQGPVSLKSTTQVHVHVQPRHLFTVWPLWPDELSLHDWEMEQQIMDLPLSTTVRMGRG